LNANDSNYYYYYYYYARGAANYYLGNMESAFLNWRKAEELVNIDPSSKISRYYR
jgi:hypothetical protein